MKPVSLAAALGKAGEVRDPGKRPPFSNRFEMLRDRSRTPSISGRSLSLAVKRRLDENSGQTKGKNPRLDGNAVFVAMEAAEAKISKGKQGIAVLKECLTKADSRVDNSLKEFLGGVVDSFDSVLDIMVDITSAMVDKSAFRDPEKVRGRDTAKAGSLPKQPGVREVTPAPSPPNEEDERKVMFIKAVKEAEKSVLVFNLDLGRVLIMNSGTMARKVTESISAKAASAEGSETGRPSEDTIAILEDTFSVMKGLELFGKVTKPFQNKQKADDPLNGKYHTLPVKMVFKDKDAKARAETVLRNTCKVQCTTPYPPRLRKVIKDTVDK